MKHTQKKKVAVIGAGAAGLSAAHYLQSRGYEVTVFEKSERVGGKCYTLTIDGKALDMGGVISTQAYHNINELARKYDMKVVPIPERSVHTDNGFKSPREGTFPGASIFSILWAFFRYILLLKKYPRVEGPGYADIPAELQVPLDEWLEKNNLSLLYNMFVTPITLYGYGYLEKTPAVHVLKYINQGNMFTILRRLLKQKVVYRFEKGFMELWNRVSKGLNVVLNANISSLQRKDGIRLIVNGEELQFDQAVLAGPPEAMLALLDADEEERNVLSRLRYYRYKTIAFRSEGMKERIIYRKPPPEIGSPWVVGKMWPESDACVAYFFGEYNDLSDSDMEKRLDEYLELIGASRTETIQICGWNYFPHFSREDMQAGLYDRLEALQGKGGVYYSGGAFAFELTEPIVAYSRHIVEKNFPFVVTPRMVWLARYGCLLLPLLLAILACRISPMTTSIDY